MISDRTDRSLVSALLAALALLAVAPGCAHRGHHPSPHGAGHHPPAHTGAAGDPLARVAAIHGAAGPFAVAGYRMGERALRELGATRGSFDLEVVHETPPEVQWSCVADGLQASTGSSPGKLNLRIVEVSKERTASVVRHRRTGKAVRFTLQPGFVQRFADLPADQAGHAGAAVMALRDDEIFVVTAL